MENEKREREQKKKGLATDLRGLTRMKNDASCRVTPALGGSYRSDSEKEFGHSDKCGNLTNPEKKHPFDDPCLDVCPILLGHEALGEVLLLLPEGEFQREGRMSGNGGRGAAKNPADRARRFSLVPFRTPPECQGGATKCFYQNWPILAH